MTLDPEIARVLARLPLIARDRMTPAEARRASRERAALLRHDVEPVARIFERGIETDAGEVRVRVYAPHGRDLPAMVYFHGGGWVLGDLEGPDWLCRALADRAGCVVASVDFPLAPEHKYPAARDACYGVTRWVSRNAAAIGVDPERIAVGGESAGGNLAAVVALLSRDRGEPRLAFQLLIVPVTDFNFDTPSYAQNAEGYGLTRAEMQWFWRHYLRGASDGADAYASPLRARDLRGLPPALVVTAEFDPLHDEGAAYARRLREAGVAVDHRDYAGAVHGFLPMLADVALAKRATDEIVAAVRAALTRSPAASRE